MRPSCLENVLQLGYTYGVVDSLEVSFKSTRPPGKCDPEIGLRARSSGATDLEKHESSPRLAARDGMEQEPYEFRIRPAKPESQGRRRTDHSANTPSLLHTKRILSADAHSELSGVCPTPQMHARSCCARRKHGRKGKRGWYAAGRPQVRREIDQSSRRPGGRALAPRDVHRLDGRDGLAPPRLGSGGQFGR